MLSSIQVLFKFPKRQLVYSKSSLAHEQLSNVVSIEISKPVKLRYKPHEFTNFVLMRKMAIKRRLVNALNDETDKDQEKDIKMTLHVSKKSSETSDNNIPITNTRLSKVIPIKDSKNQNNNNEWVNEVSSNERKERERILLNDSESEDIESLGNMELQIGNSYIDTQEQEQEQEKVQSIINAHEYKSNKTGSSKFNETLIEQCMNDYENTEVEFNTNL